MLVQLWYTKYQNTSDTMENTEKPESTEAPVKQSLDGWWIRLVRYVKRKMDERTAKKQKETPADRADTTKRCQREY